MKKTDIIKLALSGKTSEEIKNLIELETLLDIPEEVTPEEKEAPKEEAKEEETEEEVVDEEKEALKTEVAKLKEDILKMQNDFKNSDISSNDDVDILTKAQETLNNLVKNYM